MTLNSGDVLGPYQIEREIGRGGMSIVYLARHQRLDRPVAFKVLLPRLQSNADFVERFLNEARSAARLHHFNIVTTHDAGQIDGVDYIAMEYIEGESLADILHRVSGPLPFDFTLSAISQVAMALDYAHQRGIVHRDIKPSNILVRDNGHVLLTDFGIARAASATALTSAGTILGTPEYMSPEQAEGRLVDGRSDVYSLGIVTHHMLTGAPPFHGENTRATLHAHVNEAPPDPRQTNPQLPEGVTRVLRIALAKSPDQRYVTAEAFSNALRAAVTPDVPLQYSGSDTDEVKPVAKRGPSLMLLILIGLLIGLTAISFTAWYFMREQSPPPPSPPASSLPSPVAGLPVTEVAPIVVVTNTPTISPSPTSTASPSITPTPSLTPSPLPPPNLPPRIAYVSDRTGSPQIFLIHSDGSQDVQLTEAGRNEQPFWARDGSLIFFISDRTGRPALWSMRPDGSDQKELLSVAGAVSYSISPDGQHIAYAQLQGSDFDLVLDGDPWVVLPGNQTDYLWASDSSGIVLENSTGDQILNFVAVDSAAPLQLTEDSYNSWNPTWSPDSIHIAFASTRDGNAGIYTIARDGSNMVRLTSLDTWSQAPGWSPDGSQIAFVAGESDSSWGMFLIGAQGGERSRLFGPVFPEAPAVWSPNADQLAFLILDGDRELAVIDRNGGGFRQLTTNDATDWNPVWEPR
ncbi:MAG: protein kinase [Caldilineales bacterium]|nr:protein kinase [Caldilineales bacterium]